MFDHETDLFARLLRDIAKYYILKSEKSSDRTRSIEYLRWARRLAQRANKLDDDDVKFIKDIEKRLATLEPLESTDEQVGQAIDDGWWSNYRSIAFHNSRVMRILTWCPMTFFRVQKNFEIGHWYRYWTVKWKKISVQSHQGSWTSDTIDVSESIGVFDRLPVSIYSCWVNETIAEAIPVRMEIRSVIANDWSTRKSSNFTEYWSLTLSICSMVNCR